MSFSARFQYNHALVKALTTIESARNVIDLLPLPFDQVLLLRHQARRRATRNSTAIEGNTLDSQEISRVISHPARSKTVMEQEVRNYWRALDWIEEQVEENRSITEDYIRELHAIIIVRGHGRRGTLSQYRENECPVVDIASGSIDYGPPKPEDVASLMFDLVAWANGSSASELPAPIRAGLLAHRFVSIHPFSDGNGRTARALATAELWRSGYDLRGFLSLEEYYISNLAAYYGNLQMNLPVNYYDGRHDPDHTPWLNYFIGTMAEAARMLQKQAEAIHPKDRRSAPWDNLRRIQQQLLSKILLRSLDDKGSHSPFTPKDLVEWYGISANTAREWLNEWREENFVQPTRESQRIRYYRLAPPWQSLIDQAANNNILKT